MDTFQTPLPSILQSSEQNVLHGGSHFPPLLSPPPFYDHCGGHVSYIDLRWKSPGNDNELNLDEAVRLIVIDFAAMD